MNSSVPFFFRFWPLFLFFLFVSPLVNILVAPKIAKEEIRMNTYLPKVNGTATYYEEYLDVTLAAKEIRLYRQQDTVVHFIKRLNPDIYAPVFLKEWTLTSALPAFLLAIIAGFTFLMVGSWYLSGLNGITIGAITQYVAAFTALVQAVSAMSSRMSRLWHNITFLEPVFEYKDLPSQQKTGTLDVPETDLTIEFNDVSFTYPGSQEPVLKHVNLQFTPSKRMAIVGRNGSGKTTMIKILCRLYDPTQGNVTLNGIDIREYDYEQYMARLGVVFQDFELFSVAMKDNLRAGKEYIPQFANLCLEEAGILDKYTLWGEEAILHQTYDPGGINLSGGEAQKLALARALYKQGTIIALDEPTAALDPVAESDIYSRFNTFMTDKTALYISHRLSSCKFCDEIIVFYAGEVIQKGTHEQLCSQEGEYAKLWQAQAQYYA
jgi:ATP-binding cassette subfamily B protein